MSLGSVPPGSVTGLLDRLAGLAEAATPGPWHDRGWMDADEFYGQWRAIAFTPDPDGDELAIFGGNEGDYPLIVAAVNALPTLLRIARAAEVFASAEDADLVLDDPRAELRSALASLGDTE